MKFFNRTFFYGKINIFIDFFRRDVRNNIWILYIYAKDKNMYMFCICVSVWIEI